MTVVFVFGSNLAGRHGAGSAKEAVRNHGARYGIGHGRTGNAYAIPTKDRNLQPLDLLSIRLYVAKFLTYATEHPDDTFNVVKIGCGLAGFKEHEISPMFRGAPSNVNLPNGWPMRQMIR